MISMSDLKTIVGGPELLETDSEYSDDEIEPADVYLQKFTEKLNPQKLESEAKENKEPWSSNIFGDYATQFEAVLSTMLFPSKADKKLIILTGDESTAASALKIMDMIFGDMKIELDESLFSHEGLKMHEWKLIKKVPRIVFIAGKQSANNIRKVAPQIFKDSFVIIYREGLDLCQTLYDPAVARDSLVIPCLENKVKTIRLPNRILERLASNYSSQLKHTEATTKWLENNVVSPYKMFIDDMLIRDPEAKMTSNQVYGAYKEWFIDNDLIGRPLQTKQLLEKLSKHELLGKPEGEGDEVYWKGYRYLSN